MGLRFRRSIKIAPGLRLNLSPSGLSTTIGPRGASLSIGRRGTYLNTGLPGTGLSYRHRLTPSQSRTEARTVYRTLKAEREAQRNQARHEAAVAHAEHEARLAELRNVLGSRSRDEYRWLHVWGSRGSFVPAAIPPMSDQDIGELSRSTASSAAPIVGWVVVIVGLAVPAFVWGGTLTRGLAALGIVVACVWLIKACALRRSIAATQTSSLRDELARDREALASLHASEMERLQREWNEEEARLAQIRGAPERGDLNVLSAVLEVELQNEPLPVPLVLELEMNSVRDAKLEFVLPGLDDLPDDRTRLTKTGKLSTRKMSQKDHVDLFKDLCTGIALRLITETLRVLEAVDVVEVFGSASDVDPSTGHQREFVALHLETSRSHIASLNLDAVDPSASFESLGGVFLCDRKGQLRPLPDMDGLED